MKRLFNKKTIYSNTVNVPVWCWAKGDFTLPVTTLIIERTILGFQFHKIKSIYTPLDAFYDGEYSSNVYMKVIADSELSKAKVWLACEYPQQKKISNV